MLALAAAVLFVVGIFVLGTTDSWAFWMLLGAAVLSLHFAFNIAIPSVTAYRRNPPA